MNTNLREVGKALMQTATPVGWTTVVDATNLAYAKVIAACKAESEKIGKAQSCRIMVPVSERTGS